MPDENFDPMQVLAKSQKRSGMVLWEEESIHAMHPDYLPISLKKDDKNSPFTAIDIGGADKIPDVKSQGRTFSRTQFADVMERVDTSIRRIAKQMREGVISASPLKGKAKDTCERCPYRPVCRKTR